LRENFIPFGSPNFSDLEIAAVTRVLRSGWVGHGPETIAFEKELATFVGANHVVALNSCTSALFLSLKILGVGPGDEVIVPSLTWCSTANAVLHLGATPVFCDVEFDTMAASPKTMEAVLTKKTKAVIHVHYGGFASDMLALRDAMPASVAIVEDAAHALGARYPNGAPVGSSGNLTCFSFYANKNLSTGDGGAVAVNDLVLAESIRLYSQQGLMAGAWKRYLDPHASVTSGISEIGYKMNYTDLQSSIGRVQLSRQPDFSKRRLSLAMHYKKQLEAAELNIKFQAHLARDYHAHHLFVIRVPVSDLVIDRNKLLLILRQSNIGVGVHYAPLHTFSIYKPFASGILKNTESLMSEIMTLPFGASVSDEEASYVLNHVISNIEKSRKL